MTPDTLFAEMASPLGAIPQGWSLARLKDITLKIGSGATPTGGSSVYLPKREKAVLIRSQNVFDRYFDSEGLAFISDKHAAQLSSVSVQEGDVLLNITGDGVTYGRACLAPKNMLPAVVNQHVAIIRPNPELCSSGYLLSYLTHPLIKLYMESFNAGGSRRAITKGHIESFQIPLPALDIQRRIADILGTLDDKIEVNRRINRALEAMAQALFKHWFVDFGPFQDGPFVESELGLVPEGWDIVPLPEAIDVNPKRSLIKGQVAPYLEMSNMPTTSSRALDWRDRAFTSGTKFINGDVLVAKITPCLENGKTAFVDFLADNQVGWGSTEFIVLRSKPPLSLEYMYFLARSEEFRSFAIRHMVGTSGRQRVPGDSFNSYPIAIPPKNIVKQFSERTAYTMAKIKARDEESRALASMRDYLLPRLLSGEILVEAAEDVVADAS